MLGLVLLGVCFAFIKCFTIDMVCIKKKKIFLLCEQNIIFCEILINHKILYFVDNFFLNDVLKCIVNLQYYSY